MNRDVMVGEAAGVPFVAQPPRDGRGEAPTVVIWHMLDPPRSERALISPALRLASLVAVNERRFDVTYPWSDGARAVAAELDFVARAPELIRRGVPTLLVVGAEDDVEGFVRPAEELRDALSERSVEASLVRIPDMTHALADEPGLEPRPQNEIAAAVEDAVSEWLGRHLT